MPYLFEFITIATIHLLAVMSPGPDFAMIVRNSFLYSKKIGIYSAAGLALGIVVHITYSLVGIGLIISKSVVLFSAIKFVGAAYLIFIGIKSLRSGSSGAEIPSGQKKYDLGKFDALKMGFLTNILNPKATLFFLSLFTQFIDPNTPFIIQLVYGAEMSVMTFIWFSLVATILSKKKIKERFSAVRHHFERVFGAVLILLGIKVALSNSK